MKPLAILGPGTLGLSLARWAAECGLHVRLAGRNLDHVSQGLKKLSEGWDRAVAKGRMASAEAQEAMGRVRVCQDCPDAVEGAGSVLETLPEDIDLKVSAWQTLDQITPSDTLCLTGSSSISLRTIRTRAGMTRPLLGFHLFVPIHRMRIVELVHESQMTAEPLRRARELADCLRLRVAEVHDQPGYAASRMALAQGLEAMRLVESGMASAEDLDALMVHGYGHPVGPLELSDRVGLDLRLAIADQLFNATADPRFAPPDSLRQRVGQGHLGRTSGQGFYRWDSEGQRC